MRPDSPQDPYANSEMIALARRARGLTQTQLAESVGVTAGLISLGTRVRGALGRQDCRTVGGA